MREGGLRVYTTINPGLQRAATAAISHVLTEPTDPASAIVSIDPRTGAIKAMTAVTPGQQGQPVQLRHERAAPAGLDVQDDRAHDRGRARHGSVPHVVPVGAAPLPARLDVQPERSELRVERRRRTSTRTSGVESVANATVQSDNTVYARLSLDVGPENIVAMARKLGIRTSPLEAVPSIALGSVARHAARDGVRVRDARRRRRLLEADGDHEGRAPEREGRTPTPDWGKPQRERVIPDWVASTVTQVLEQNMLYGTGRGAHVSNHTDAGKTGTTDNYADAWFSGYTPRLEATVWIGYPSGEIPMLSVHGIAVSGPTFPAQIWHLYMDTAIGNRPDVPFPPAQTQPVWTSWHGQYQYGGSYGYVDARHDDAARRRARDDDRARHDDRGDRAAAPPRDDARVRRRPRRPSRTAAAPPPPTVTGAVALAGVDGASSSPVRSSAAARWSWAAARSWSAAARSSVGGGAVVGGGGRGRRRRRRARRRLRGRASPVVLVDGCCRRGRRRSSSSARRRAA